MKKRFCTALLASALAVSSFVPVSTTLMMAEETTTQTQNENLIYSHDELVTLNNGAGVLTVDEADVANFADLSSMTFETRAKVTANLSALFFVGNSAQQAHYASVYINGHVFGIECLTAGGTRSYSTSVTLNDIDFTQEHLLAVSFAASDKVTFYVDGEKVHEAAVTTNFVKDVLSGVDYVGFGKGNRASGANNYPMTGTMSDIRIYSNARSAEEIRNDQLGNLNTVLVKTDSIKNGADLPAGDTSAQTIDSIKDLTEGSWSTRFRLDGTKTGVQYLASLSNSTQDREFVALYVYRNNGTWQAGVDAPGKSIGGTVNIPSTIDVADTNWHDFTVVREGTKWTFYIDGTSIGEASSTNEGFFNVINTPDVLTSGWASRAEGQPNNPTAGAVESSTVFSGKLNAAEAKILSKELSSTGVEVPDLSNAYLSEKQTLFNVGYDSSNAYRIPSMITTMEGTVLVGIDKRNDGFGDQGNIDFAVRRKESGSSEFDEPIMVCDLLRGQPGQKSPVLIDSVLLQDTDPQSPHTGRIHALMDMFTQSNAAMELGNQTPGDECLRIDGQVYRKVYKDGETQPYAVVEEDGIGVIYTTVTTNGTTVLGTKTDYTVTLHTPAPYTQLGNLYKAGEYKGNIYMNEEGPDKGELHMKKTMSIWHFYSDDDGKTWSEPSDITSMIKEDWMIFLGTGPGRGVQLDNGRLVFPAYTCNSTALFNSQCSTIIVSNDYGETWSLKGAPAETMNLDRATMTSGTITTECQPVKLRNGNLLLFMRTQSGKVKYAVSTDNGESWDGIETVDIPAVYCQYSVISYFDQEGNEYLIVANPSGPSRENGILTRGKVNDDGTIAWETDKTKLFEPTGYAYSCLTEIAPAEDGTKRFANFYELNNNPISLEYVEFDENYLTADNVPIEDTAPVLESFEAEQIPAAASRAAQGDTIRVTAVFNQRVFLEGAASLTVQAGDETLELPMISGSGDNSIVFEGSLPADFVGTVTAVGLNAESGQLTSLHGISAASIEEQQLLDTSVIRPVSVVSYTSQFSSSTAEGADGAAVNIIDGNPNTHWHSHYTNSLVMPQQITFDFGQEVTIDQLNFLNRQSSTNALCKEFRLEVSSDNSAWKTVLDSEMAPVQSWQSVPFTSTTTRYVRFSVDSVHSGNLWATIAELNFNLAVEGVERSADKTSLQKVYADASKLTAAIYTDASWALFQDEMKKADELLKDPAASQPLLDLEVNALRNAMRALTQKSELEQMLADYAKLISSDYEAGRWNAFASAVDDVTASYEDYATHNEMDAAIMSLKYLERQLQEAEVQLTGAVIRTESTVNPGSSLALNLIASPADAVIRSATWSVSDADGNAVPGVMIAADADDPAAATLTVADSVENGTVLTVSATALNGTELSAQKTVTVRAIEETLIRDYGPNHLHTSLPETAQIVDVNGKKAMDGYLSLDDSQKTVTNYLTSGESFTASTRVYIPASVASTSSGSLESGEKMNMILSIGDDSFAFRFNANSEGTKLQSYAKVNGSWRTLTTSALDSSVFDSWHEVTTTYDAQTQTLKIFLDGQQLGTLDGVGTPTASDLALEIGYMNSHIATRKSDLKYSNVKILKGAKSAGELEEIAAGTSNLSDEDVVLWLDFAGVTDERQTLDTAIASADALKEEEYTADSWSAFESAKANAKAMNATYATADNLSDAKTALEAAMEALVKADTPTPAIDTTLLEQACKKAAAVEENLASFNAAGQEAFETAKAAADQELSDPSSQAEVNAKAKALAGAMLVLRLNPDPARLADLK